MRAATDGAVSPEGGEMVGEVGSSSVRTASALVTVVLLALAAIMVGTTPARAHDEVISRTPAAGSTVDAAPQQVVLEFNEAPMSVGATIRVIDAQGQDWGDGDPVFDGSLVSQPLRDGMPAGNYQVRWRIVSQDGHPISESFDFSVGASASASAMPSPTVDGTAEAASSGDAVVVDRPDAQQDATGSPARIAVAAAIGAGVVAFGLLVWRLRSRRARR